MKFKNATMISLLIMCNLSYGNEVQEAVARQLQEHYEITDAEIQRFKPRSIPEALRMIPGFYLLHPSGADEIAGKMGMNNEAVTRYKVYVDDILINQPTTGLIYWNSLPVKVSDILKIDYYPQFSSTFSGQSGVQGVIKIYTKGGFDKNYVKASIGSRSNRSLSGNFGGIKFSENGVTDYFISSYLDKNDGYHTVTDTNKMYGVRGKIVHKNSSIGEVFASVSLGFQDAHDEVSNQERSRYLKNRRISNKLLNFGWSKRVNSTKFEMYAGIHGVDVRSRNEVTKIPDYWTGSGNKLTVIYPDDHSSLRKMVTLHTSTSFDKGVLLNLKGSYHEDESIPFEWTKDKVVKSYGDVSAKLMIPVSEESHLFIGVNKGYFENYGFSRYNLQVGGNWKKNDTSVSVSFAQAERIPALWELYSTHHLYIKENPNIKLYRHLMDSTLHLHERSDSLALTVKQKIGSVELSNTLHKDFYYDLEYLYFEDTTPGAGIYQSPNTGLPLSSYLKINKGDKFSVTALEGVASINNPVGGWNARASYFFRLQHEEPDSNAIKRKNLYPRSTINLVVEKKTGKYDWALAAGHVSGFKGEEAKGYSGDRKDLKDYAYLDINISFLGVFYKKDEVSLSIINVMPDTKDTYKTLKNDRVLLLTYEAEL